MGSLLRGLPVVLILVALVAVSAPAQSRGPDMGAPEASAQERPDLHRWRMTRHGFGRLKVGLNRTKIERRLGRRLRFSYNTGPCAIWGIRGVRGLAIMTVNGRLARVDAFRGTWRTSLGVRVGDTEAEVRELYPRLRT